ncbi:hypothetical protein G7Y89_g9512 [Cudoniella acicularis]|uniref:Uncharacterized protein n=1 Tax=Cudoniella acicularis TaxID=354080 RepID=A0A8H4REI5_9HELO|nr:hypothetical protein G7Y89_g9512 [Cudoniella acicularis]
MSQKTLRDSPYQSLQYCWPEKFTKRRKFDRKTENQTYIQYLETQLYYGEEEEEEEEEDDDNSTEDEDEDDVEEHQDKSENQDAKECNGRSVVRRFMKGVIGDEDTLQYHDQVEEVSGFCEHARVDSETGTVSQNAKHIALLDDRSAGNCRPHLGPLTAQQLRNELSKKRFKVESDQDFATGTYKDEEIDAERRLIFIPDLDPLTIEAIITTAPITQAPALRDLFYKHLTGKASIGVTIPSQGFSVFTLEFHIPPTTISTSRDEHICLYEAQTSVVVTGIDQWVWAAYGFVDNYFGSNETVDYYHLLRGKIGGHPDPLAAGRLNADEPIWTPREYFLQVCQIRSKRVLKEWNYIMSMIKSEIEWPRDNHEIPLPYSDPKNTSKLRDISAWNTQMMALLSRLIGGLSETVQAWEAFRSQEMGYFIYHSESGAPLSPIPSLIAINKIFEELNFNLRKLEELKKELCESSPQALHAHLSFENNAASTFQQSAKKLEDLTVITVIFFPMALAANLFMLILGALIAAIPVTVSNRRFWLQSILDATQQLITFYNARQLDGEKFCKTYTSPRDSQPPKRRIFAKKPLPPKDTEWGPEAGLMDAFLERPESEIVPKDPGMSSASSSRNSSDSLSLLDEMPGSFNLTDPFTPTVQAELLDSPGKQFRLSEINEDLLHPDKYKSKLRRLQAHIFRESATSQYGIKTGMIHSEVDLTSDSRFQECQKFLTCIERNLTVLRDAGFCSAVTTFLQIDPNRTQVAFLRSVELDKVAQLGSCIGEKNISLKDLGVLDRACKELLGDYLGTPCPLRAGDFTIISLRVLDLVLVSHVCSHMSDFDHWMSKDTSTVQKFQISTRTSSIIDCSVISERGTLSFSRRTLKCLNGFLCGEKVWVLHGPNMDPTDPTELFLSITPDAFADAWGPMWKINNAGKPMETLRYDLEHGSIVPLSLISGSREHSAEVETEPNEELCHWIPNSELEELERILACTSPPQIIQPRLLIGACHHSVTPNTEHCYCNLTDANDRFVSNGYRRIMGSSTVKWVTESQTMGTAASGGGLMVPTIQYSHTWKRDGTLVKEAFHKRWKNSQQRPWKFLLMRFGLQLSICTRNSRKVRVVDLIAGDTMREYMRTFPSYASEPWREEFEDMLDKDPAKLVNFKMNNPLERKGIEQYVTNCLDGLFHTGIGSRGNDPFVAFWVYHNQPWEIAFPRQCHGWTGFAEDSDSRCSFVVLEKCLVNVLGLKCCHPRENMPEEATQRMRKDTPAVLETFLKISERAETPNGLHISQKENGRQYWSVGSLKDRKHCIMLGKQGKLEGKGFRSKRVEKGGRHSSRKVLTGKWSSESRLAATARVLSAYITPPEAHTEHICDGSEDGLPPLPYHVLDRT